MRAVLTLKSPIISIDPVVCFRWKGIVISMMNYSKLPWKINSSVDIFDIADGPSAQGID